MRPTLPDALDHLRQRVAPRAALIDRSPDDLRSALHGLAGAGLLGLRVPTAHGGADWSQRDFRRWQHAAARTSGILAFLQTQHQSACAVVAQSPDGAKRQRWLSHMATGELRCGIAFSHLRKSGPPALVATPHGQGWRLSGEARWVTGWGLFDHCLSAATRADGAGILFVIHSLSATEHLRPSAPMALAAFEAAGTVGLSFRGLEVPEQNVMLEAPLTWIQERDLANVANQSMFALGTTAAALDVLGGVARREGGAASDAHSTLSARAKALQAQIEALLGDPARFAEALGARAAAIAHMGTCAHAAVAASAGSANLSGHPAQRIWREALMFTVLSQTPSVRAQTLRALAQ